MADDRDGARSDDETQQFDPFADDVDEPPAPDGADAGSGGEEISPDVTAPLPASDETAPMSAVSPDETAPMAAADETAPIPAWSGRAGVPPADATAIRGPVPPDWEPAPDDERRWWMPILLGIIALLLLGVLVVGIWLIMRANDSGTGDETPTPTASVVPTTAVAPTTAAPPTSAPATATSGPVSIEVPRVVGLTQADAQARLDAAGLPYRLEFRPSDRPAGTVIDTDPAGGMTVPEGTQVVLVIAESAPTSAPPTSAPTSDAAGPSPTS